MAEQEVPTKGFKEQMADERAFYLRKTDIIPGTDITVKDAKAEYEDQRAAANKASEERRIEYLKSRQPQEGVVRTTVVVPGVLANVEPKSQIEISEKEIADIESGAADNKIVSGPSDPGLTKEALLKETKETLYLQASGLRLIGPDTEYTKDQLADIILAEADAAV